MRILVVSGIWPPDVGGPASHAPEFAEYLLARGHDVEAVTTADREPAREAYAVHWTPRRLPVGARHVHGAALVRKRSGRADVVYSTGMLGRTIAGSRRPVVAKLTQDPAFERALRRGSYRGSVERFELDARSVGARLLRAARTAQVRRAAHVVCPSEFLRALVLRWGIPPERVSVVPNAVPRPAELEPRDDVRASLGVDGPLLAFAGRLTEPKALGVALDALAAVDGASLVLAGDGDRRADLERRARELGLDGRVTFLGAQSRERVLSLFRAADAVLLSSSWENFPHAAVEGLGVGTPVIATAVGGVPEIVRDGENGLLVAPGDPRALADAIERYLADESLRGRLRDGAKASVERFAPETVYARLEQIVVDAAK